jgi:hypothetical protein
MNLTEAFFDLQFELEKLGIPVHSVQISFPSAIERRIVENALTRESGVTLIQREPPQDSMSRIFHLAITHRHEPTR